jgi:hypothetical protein
MSASDYAELALLNSLFGKTSNFGALASRPTLYVALCTAAPTDASTGSTITEATYTGYARVSTATTDWNAATGTSPATVTNANAVTFGACTAGSSTITHFALVDASSAGNVILWGALSSPSSLAVSTGITPSFAAGALSATCD